MISDDKENKKNPKGHISNANARDNVFAKYCIPVE
jgi:hypothetical protein